MMVQLDKKEVIKKNYNYHVQEPKPLLVIPRLMHDNNWEHESEN